MLDKHVHLHTKQTFKSFCALFTLRGLGLIEINFNLFWFTILIVVFRELWSLNFFFFCSLSLLIFLSLCFACPLLLFFILMLFLLNFLRCDLCLLFCSLGFLLLYLLLVWNSLVCNLLDNLALLGLILNYLRILRLCTASNSWLLDILFFIKFFKCFICFLFKIISVRCFKDIICSILFGLKLAIILKLLPVVLVRIYLSMVCIKLVIVELIKSIETLLANFACIWLQLTSLFLKSLRLKKNLLLSFITALCPLLYKSNFV